jgi:hypothetical protein
LGPFDVARVIATCGAASEVPQTNSFTVTFRVVANDSEVRVRKWRFVAGIALVAFAPRLADVAAAYYVAGALLGVVALAFLFVAKMARAVPGGRATRAGAGVLAAVSAFVVPQEHVSKVLEMYVSLWLAPARLTLAAARRALFPNISSSSSSSYGSEMGSYDLSSSTPDDSYLTLAYALAGTVLTLAGAGAGLWATRAWVIEKKTGDVSTHVAAFARVAARALGAVLLQFCSLDSLFGGAAASIAVAMAVADNARAMADAWRGRGGDVYAKGRRNGRRGEARAGWILATDGSSSSPRRAIPTRRNVFRLGGEAEEERVLPRGGTGATRAKRTTTKATRLANAHTRRPAGTGSAEPEGVARYGGGDEIKTSQEKKRIPHERWTPSRGPRPWCFSGRARARWARPPAGPPAPGCGRGCFRRRFPSRAVAWEAATRTPRRIWTATRCSRRGTARRRRTARRV